MTPNDGGDGHHRLVRAAGRPGRRPGPAVRGGPSPSSSLPDVECHRCARGWRPPARRNRAYSSRGSASACARNSITCCSTSRSALEDAAAEAPDRSPEIGHEEDVSGRYRAALKWLNAKGVAAIPPDLALTKLSAAVPDSTLDHVGFAAGNLDAVIEALRVAGATPARRTEDSAFFRADGLIVEITRDTDLPDVLWCPMHPDVRAGSPGKCPICAMDLVPDPAAASRPVPRRCGADPGGARARRARPDPAHS